MRPLALLLLMLLAAAPLQAQTDTPVPTASPTGGMDAAATLTALPTYELLGGSPTLTPWPTVNWPTLTPDPRLTPVPWMGIGLQEMTPGGPYVPPDLPALDGEDLPGVDTPNGFQAINDANIAGFMVYIIDVALSFYKWFAVNLPQLLLAARWLVMIMMILYGVYYIWKGRKFVPPGTEPGFFKSFRLGGRYYYYSRGRRKEARNNDGPRQERML